PVADVRLVVADSWTLVPETSAQLVRVRETQQFMKELFTVQQEPHRGVIGTIHIYEERSEVLTAKAGFFVDHALTLFVSEHVHILEVLLDISAKRGRQVVDSAA